MQGYEVLPHTADLRIRATGRTPEELFRQALCGIGSVMQPSAFEMPPTVRREIAVAAPDEPSLLVDFLSQALSLAQVNREVYTEVWFGELTARSLRATLHGVPVDGFEKDIKAVTYHGVEIKESDEGYGATIIYDI